MRVIGLLSRLFEIAVKAGGGAVGGANSATSYRMRHATCSCGPSLIETIGFRRPSSGRKVLFRVSSVRGGEVKSALWAPDVCVIRTADLGASGAGLGKT